MSKSIRGKMMLRSVIVFHAALVLAGCQNEALLEDTYEPVTAAERYPIRVVSAPVKTDIRAPAGVLSSEQRNGVTNFASAARRTASARISVRYPSGSGAMRKAANEAVVILKSQGIPAQMISIGAYSGSSRMPIRLSFEHKVAVTKECGDWSEDIGAVTSNEPHSNFGCAIQNNVAAMVANPNDFEQPRAMGPLMAGNRTENMKIYIQNSTSGDYWTHDGESKSN